MTINPNITPEADNTAWFAEVSMPLVGESNARPGVHRLTLYLAGRYDDYEIEGPFEGILEPNSTRGFDDFVPKIGLAWYPAENWKIRVSWAEAFQAPTLPELFSPTRFWNQPHSRDFFWFLDPLNPESNGGQFTRIFPEVAEGGNPDLQPQLSETTSIGFETTPDAIAGLYFSATWSKTDFENLISTLDLEFGRHPQYAVENWEQFPGLVERNAEGVLTKLYLRQAANFTNRTSEAVDIQASYNFSTAMGDFTAGVFATRTLALETTPAAGADPVVQVGTSVGPSKFKGNVWLDWISGNWTAHLTLHHSTDYELADPNARRTDISSYSTVDVQATYAVPGAGWASGWRVAVGVENLLDKDFPFVDNYTGVDSAHVDFRRRIIFMDIAKEFSF